MYSSSKFNNKKKVFRVSTVPVSLNVLLKGQLNFLNSYFDIVAISSPGEDLNEVSQREKVKTYPIKIERKISIFSDIYSLINLIIFFYKNKPLIVHSITPKAGFLSMMAAYVVGVPVRIHTFTGLIFPTESGLKKLLLKKIDRLTCFFATNVYPEGNGVKTDLIINHITTKPLIVIANGNINGIDATYFDPELIPKEEIINLKRDLNICLNCFVFVFVGRLVGDKGINQLIDAFSKINDCKVKLLLVGEFEHDLDPLKKETINEIDRNINIISVGFQKDVRPYFAISNCLVFPSYREGFPNVVMQAGAMGLPSIVSDINGCNEIIEEGINGTIIPSKDIELLLFSMQRIIKDEVWRNQLASNARKRIISRYEQKSVWKAILTEYNNLLIEKGL
jgi:glycosyltransferase involved in cell wall biosynthesis